MMFLKVLFAAPNNINSSICTVTKFYVLFATLKQLKVLFAKPKRLLNIHMPS
jgi:hypothetical protein